MQRGSRTLILEPVYGNMESSAEDDTLEHVVDAPIYGNDGYEQETSSVPNKDSSGTLGVDAAPFYQNVVDGAGSRRVTANSSTFAETNVDSHCVLDHETYSVPKTDVAEDESVYGNTGELRARDKAAYAQEMYSMPKKERIAEHIDSAAHGNAYQFVSEYASDTYSVPKKLLEETPLPSSSYEDAAALRRAERDQYVPDTYSMPVKARPTEAHVQESYSVPVKPIKSSPEQSVYTTAVFTSAKARQLSSTSDGYQMINDDDVSIQRSTSSARRLLHVSDGYQNAWDEQTAMYGNTPNFSLDMASRPIIGVADGYQNTPNADFGFDISTRNSNELPVHTTLDTFHTANGSTQPDTYSHLSFSPSRSKPQNDDTYAHLQRDDDTSADFATLSDLLQEMDM